MSLTSLTRAAAQRFLPGPYGQGWPLKATFVALVLTLAVGCAGVASSPPSQTGSAQPAPDAVPVTVVTAKKGRLGVASRYSGNVQARAAVGITAKVGGRVKKLHVDVGSQVKAGEVIAELDTDLLDAQLAQAEAGLALAAAKLATIEEGPRKESIALAEANARAARERLASLQEGGRKEQIAQAQANLQAAEARLRDALAGATPEQIAIAEAQVRVAKNQLYSVQSQADAYLGSRAHALGTLVFSREMKEAAAGVAWEQIQLAEAQLAALKAPPRQDQISQLQAGVDAARSQLALAQDPYSTHDVAQAAAAAEAAEQQLALAKDPFTDNDRKAAKAAVDQAQATVDLVELQIREATIVAPFEGTVAQRFVSEGAVVGTSNPIVSVVSSSVDVLINVEEARLAEVKLGQKASIEVAAYSGQQIPGTVAAISPVLDPRSRTVVVKVRPQASEPVLLDGMFAQVQLEGESQTEAVLAPARAVFQRDGKTWLVVVTGGKASLREVVLGRSDGSQTAVLQGLAEGEQVVVVGQEGLADGQSVIVQP